MSIALLAVAAFASGFLIGALAMKDYHRTNELADLRKRMRAIEINQSGKMLH